MSGDDNLRVQRYSFVFELKCDGFPLNLQYIIITESGFTMGIRSQQQQA